MHRILVVLACLTALGCARRDPTGGFIDPALAVLVPAETVMLAGVKVESIRETPIYRKYLENSKLLRIDEFSARTGFEPRKDLWKVLIAFDGKEALVMARGRFSEMGREPKSLPNVKRMSYKGYTVLGDDQSGVLFVNASTALAGSLAALHAAVDRKDSSRGVPARLLEQVKTLPAYAQIWVAALGGHIVFPDLQGNAANLGKILSEMQSATLAIDLRNGLKLEARASYGDGQQALQTRDALRALLGIARLTTPSTEVDVLKAYDQMQVEQAGNAVQFGAQLEPGLMEKLAARVASQFKL